MKLTSLRLYIKLSLGFIDPKLTMFLAVPESVAFDFSSAKFVGAL